MEFEKVEENSLLKMFQGNVYSESLLRIILNEIKTETNGRTKCDKKIVLHHIENMSEVAAGLLKP